MATLTNQSEIILQATDYRFVDPLIELKSYDSNSITTIIDPKFTKLTDVAALSPALVVLNSTMTNTIGTSASLPTPTQYYWEYSTTTNPNTWIALSPQPTYGVGYATGTLQLTNTLFKTHVGTGNTGVYYRLTLKYNVEDDVVGPRFLVSYVAQANTYPTIELSKPTVFIPTTSTTVDFSTSTFDLNVRVGTTYLRYDASVTPAVNTFKVGTGVVRVGTTTIGAMTLADRNKATNGTVSANDTAVFANFSGAGTTDFALLEYPVTIKDIDGNTISISIQQSLVKQKTGQDGASAASFTIVNTAPILNKNSAGVISPTTLVLTTQLLNITGTITYQWYKDNVLITTTTGVAPNQVVTPVTTSSYSIPLADYASVTSNTYKCVITGTINGVAGSTLSDEVTVPLLVDGSSTIQVLHTNQNFIFTAPTTGYAGISFTGGSDTLKVYIGTTALNYNTTGANTYSIAVTNNPNILVTTSFTTGSTDFVVNAPTGIDAETVALVLTITVRNAANVTTTITTTINYSLSRAGDIGPSGPSFYIANSAPIFKKDSAGVFSPPSILTLTTQYANIIGPITYKWYKNDSATAIVGAISSSYPVPIADYAGVTSNTYKCTISGTVGSFNVSLSDVVTIPLLIDGSSAIQVSNSNENITFSAPATGTNGISFTNGGSVIRVYLGTTLLSYAISGANTFSCTIANTGVTVADGTGTGTTFTVPAPTVMGTETATTVVTVTIRDSAAIQTIITTTISYSLSRAGATGLSGALFEITNSAPIFKKNSAGVFSPPSILTLNTQFLYITGTPTYKWYKNDSTTAIVGASSSSYPVPIADYAGVTSNTYKCTISGIIGGVANSTLSDEVTIPLLIDGSNAIQVSNSNENITFSAPATGTNGISFTNGGSVIRVYLGTTLLSYAASGANTFSCAYGTGAGTVAVAPGVGSGTTFTVPAPTDMTTETATTVVTVTIRDSAAVATTTTTTISYSLSRAGTAGTNGTRTAIMEMYRWSALAPITFPAGTSDYTWSTGQFTAPATLNSWSLTPPTAVVGQTLWVCRTVYADSLSINTTSITWNATAAYAAGAAGTNGVNGARTAFLELYKWSAATPTTWPTGSSTYTWTNGTFTLPATPNGWALTPGASTAGYILYGTSVTYSDTGTGGTTSIAWPTTGQVAYAVGAAGGNGANGSAVYFIDRNTGTASSAPTNVEVTAAIGRNAIVGDIATIRYTASGSITSISYRCTAVTPTWVVQTTYISGSVVVDGSLTATKITSGKTTYSTGAAGEGTDAFALGGDSVIAGGKAAAEFTTSGTLKWGALAQNSTTSSTVSTAHALGAFCFATNSKAIIAYNYASSIVANNRLRSITTLNSGTVGIQGTILKASSYNNTNNSATPGNAECTFTLGVADGIGYFQKYWPNVVAPGTSNQKWIMYFGNDDQDAAISASKFATDGATVVKQVKLCTSGFAVIAQLNQGKIHAVDGFTAFTGAHIGWSNVIIDDGDIVVDDVLISKDSISATNFSQKASTIPNQKGVIGVVSRCEYWFKNISSTYTAPQPTPIYSTDNVQRFQEHPEPSFDEDPWYGYDYRLDINALGDGQVNVCGENGDIEMGDLIVTSSIMGKGMRQADDIVRSYTVAKAREAVTFSAPNEVKTIACIYLCG